MIIEYISNVNTYKEKLKALVLPESVDHSVRKNKGQDNYILKLKTDGNSIKDAKVLSDARDMVERLLQKEKVVFKMLSNGASQLLVKELYPLMCEYETKLRKFIHFALFDISEAAKDSVIAQLKKAHIEIKDKDINFDFLEYAEIGDIVIFLFANDDLYSDFDKYKKDHRFSTRQELIEYIQNSEKKTIWEQFFAEAFEDSILPTTIWEIKNYRNDVMHFHNISYDDYEKALELVKKGIKDLDKQIKKGIVLEESEENVATLSANPSYSGGLIYSNPVLLDQVTKLQPKLPSIDAMSIGLSQLSYAMPYIIKNASGDFYANLSKLPTTLGIIPDYFRNGYQGIWPGTRLTDSTDDVTDTEEGENNE